MGRFSRLDGRGWRGGQEGATQDSTIDSRGVLASTIHLAFWGEEKDVDEWKTSHWRFRSDSYTRRGA